MAKIRPDLASLEAEYAAEMKKPVGSRIVTRLEKLVIAFDKLMKLDPLNPNSFFWLASYHGYSSTAVYTAQRKLDKKNGIYCAHGIIDFITWHRPYMSRFEKALQSFDLSVMLPFWNEISDDSLTNGIPKTFSNATFLKSDGTSIPNPLQAYTYQSTVVDSSGNVLRSAGTKTQRAPGNIGPGLRANVLPRVKAALKNGDYNTFAYFNGQNEGSIEDPHNWAHVTIGGNDGDMSSVPISAFDPIFYFHHAFFDMLFWTWQKKFNKISGPLIPNVRYLIPWRKSVNPVVYFQNTATNIAIVFQYDYPDFEEQKVKTSAKAGKLAVASLRGAQVIPKVERSRRILLIRGIHVQKFGGTFKVHAYAKTKDGNKYFLGSNLVFHAPSGCDNCEILNTVNLQFEMKAINKKNDAQLKFRIKFKMADGAVLQFKQELTSGFSAVVRLMDVPLEISY